MPQDDQEIKTLLGGDLDTSLETQVSVDYALKRTRQNIYKRDAMLFAFVKFWTTLAKILAPVFAYFARQQKQIKTYSPQTDLSKNTFKK